MDEKSREMKKSTEEMYSIFEALYESINYVIVQTESRSV